MGVAIVAIPSRDDYVWKISSEKVPHMTMLYLGEINDDAVIARITEFVQHVAEMSMYRFGMSVDRRGVLGPDEADVLFLRNDYAKMALAARNGMLSNVDIRRAYNSVPQYEGWTPHVTLGYPATPAKPIADDRRIGWVDFDTVSVWTGDSTGPEFLLRDRWEEESLAMSQDLVENILAHHGVKGMKWGVRKDRHSSDVTVIHRPGKSLRSRGGERLPAHEDAVKAQIAKQKAKKSSVHSLSNHELQQLVNRMNLEQQYARLSSRRKGEGQRFVEEQLKNLGRQKASTLFNK